MTLLINTFHPDLDDSNVNMLWAKSWEKAPHLPQTDNKTSVTVRDMAAVFKAKGFDPQEEQRLLETHERIVIQFPLFWYSAPALFKIWLDEIFSYEWACGPKGFALEGKEALLAVSIGAPEESYDKTSYNKQNLQTFLSPIEQTFRSARMSYLDPFFFFNTALCTKEERLKSVTAYQAHLLQKR